MNISSDRLIMPEFVKQVPSNCVQCAGPLMYDPERYVSPTGVIYKNVGSRGYQIVGNNTRDLINWPNAQKQLPDKSVVAMEAIPSVYSVSQNSVNRRFLIAYYFVEKVDPEGKAVNKIDRSGDVIASNLIWVDASAKKRSTRKNAGMSIVEYAEVLKEEAKIKGGNAKPEKVIYQVDPQSMDIINEIPCVGKFVIDNSDFAAASIHTAAAKCGKYKDYIWLEKANSGKYFDIVDGKVVISLTIDKSVRHIREQLYNHLTSGSITEDMLPIDSEGNISASPSMIEILNKLDPRGRGDLDNVQAYANNLESHIPCSYVLSYHGNTKTMQLVICLKTLLVFLRSKENVGENSPKCPICECGDRTNFGMSNPECSIPIYRYDRPNAKDPYAFQRHYLTMTDFLLKPDGTYRPNGQTLKNIRESLFGKSSGTYPNGNPKRGKVDNSIYSFYPPTDGYMREDNADWLLQRRLASQIFQEMRKVALK